MGKGHVLVWDLLSGNVLWGVRLSVECMMAFPRPVTREGEHTDAFACVCRGRILGFSVQSSTPFAIVDIPMTVASPSPPLRSMMFFPKSGGRTMTLLLLDSEGKVRQWSPPPPFNCVDHHAAPISAATKGSDEVAAEAEPSNLMAVFGNAPAASVQEAPPMPARTTPLNHLLQGDTHLLPCMSSLFDAFMDNLLLPAKRSTPSA
eukprot:NODE_109_length_1399_cov_470.310370_g87_i0.p1 GENE.NODE_109_length_1399_cov_470.310370_g87_i0~~NODE_109_length_1399_cov_470.310370_g87_i0.p1  ORF type:complete len:213 (+),score=46.64 NODE_109_length_1399_cov_470.310370_g87_i0:30-641(+)